MDGRVQQPIIDWMKHHYQADYIDMITEPGPIKDLANNQNPSITQSIKQRTHISINKHQSNLIAIIGHHDCAGNPLPKDKQINQIKDSIKTIQTWGYKTEIIGLWIDENWTVHKI
jgi:hypothetical protein